VGQKGAAWLGDKCFEVLLRPVEVVECHVEFAPEADGLLEMLVSADTLVDDF